MKKDIWVVIPTYWGKPEAGIYDHPTPLDGESTLPALLNTLVAQDFQGDFRVLVLVSTTEKELNETATGRVEEIIGQYSTKLDLTLADHRTARMLDRYFMGFGLDLDFGEMQGYAAVRNMQLLFPAAQGAEIIIALDDDELVAADYLTRATSLMGRSIDGEKMVALAGPYLDDSGSPYLEEPVDRTNLLLDKAILMNQAMRRLCEEPKRISISPIAFGGNMVFHRDMFTRIGFDPGITRGEDIDYLINAKIAGFNFFFDPDLSILHCPPRHFEGPLYARLRQDVIRFEYERVKIDFFGLSPEILMPYPGALLTEGFSEIALDALRKESSTDLKARYGSPEEILEFSSKIAVSKPQKYQEFQSKWVKAMEVVFKCPF